MEDNSADLWRKFVALLAVCLMQWSVVVAQDEPPHIIFILIDDGGFNDAGFHGSTQIPTPNMDALAYSGVILNNHYALPLCTPSRVALLTGIYPYRYGMASTAIRETSSHGLPTNLTIVPQFLKQKGYATHYVGKWHVGHASEIYAPTSRGFDSFLGFWLGSSDYWNHLNFDNDSEGETGWVGYDFRRNMDVEWTSDDKYITEVFGNESVSIIQNHNASQPLFLLLSHGGVHAANRHDPLQAPSDTVDMLSYIDDLDRRTYGAMIWEIDETVGKVVTALDQKQMLQNSIIVLASDNGGPSSREEASGGYNVASNWPLRGEKRSLWEGGVKSLSFIWSPYLNSPGRVSHQLLHFTDWLPTLVSAAGGGIDLGALDGMDAWSALVEGSQSPRTDLLINIDLNYQMAGLREGDWKLIHRPTISGKPFGEWLGHTGRNATSPQESWPAIKSGILNSEAAEAVLKIYPDAYDSIEQIRADAMVNCSAIPPNATTTEDCDVRLRPCLFNVVDDPCEYFDRSQSEPLIYDRMLAKLLAYNASSVPSPVEVVYEESNPIYWNNTWNNWLDYPSPLTTEIK